LTDFALTLERSLHGFQMTHMLVDDDQLAAFLPRMTKLMERRRSSLSLTTPSRCSPTTAVGATHDGAR
jgi:hypothetical protein